MELNKSLMKKVLKEEYDKRLDFFLNEKITITTKYGANVIKDALGLKVYDKAGFRYTFAGIVIKAEEEFAKLILPEEPFGNEKGSGASPLFEKDNFDDNKSLGFIVRRNKESGKRDVEFDASSPGAFDSYGQDLPEDLPKIKDQDAEDSLSTRDPKYILVPMGEFEERFSIN